MTDLIIDGIIKNSVPPFLEGKEAEDASGYKVGEKIWMRNISYRNPVKMLINTIYYREKDTFIIIKGDILNEKSEPIKAEAITTSLNHQMITRIAHENETPDW